MKYLFHVCLLVQFLEVTLLDAQIDTADSGHLLYMGHRASQHTQSDVRLSGFKPVTGQLPETRQFRYHAAF